MLTMSLAILLRLYAVNQKLKTRTGEVTDLSVSGYVPPGVFGHGYLKADGALPSWYIYDEPAENGMVRKVCGFKTLAPVDKDIDFFYHDGAWHKLRTGTVIFTEKGPRIEPVTTKWKNVLRSQTSFPVRRPDWPYRLKIFWTTLRHGGGSPLIYLEDLHRYNPSCKDMPAP